MRPPIGAAAQWPTVALLARMRRVSAEHEVCERVLVIYMRHERGEQAVPSLPHQGDHLMGQREGGTGTRGEAMTLNRRYIAERSAIGPR
eukprot:6946783-Pyramimonas_sp.AAC.1